MQKVTLTVVAKPEIPDYIIREKVESIKRLEIINKQRTEWRIKQDKLLAIKLAKIEREKQKKEEKMKKQAKKNKGKGKKVKSKEGKEELKVENEKLKKKIEPEPEPTFEVREEEIVLNYLDFYPAEMVLWRNFKEYGIEGLFTCIVRYETDNL